MQGSSRSSGNKAGLCGPELGEINGALSGGLSSLESLWFPQGGPVLHALSVVSVVLHSLIASSFCCCCFVFFCARDLPVLELWPSLALRMCRDLCVPLNIYKTLSQSKCFDSNGRGEKQRVDGASSEIC